MDDGLTKLELRSSIIDKIMPPDILAGTNLPS